jgi:hypothetical protein
MRGRDPLPARRYCEVLFSGTWFVDTAQPLVLGSGRGQLNCPRGVEAFVHDSFIASLSGAEKSVREHCDAHRC